MRKKIQGVLAALALFIMTVADASCSKCSQENNNSDFRSCLCNLAGLGAKRKTIIYVSNSPRDLTSACEPLGSLDCPYTTIAAAVNQSPEGVIIRVLFTAHPYVISSPISLKPRQVLEGWNLTGTTFPTIALQSSLSRGIILANHARVSHFIITGTETAGQVGIESNGANHAVISNNTFSNFETSVYLVPVAGTKTSVIRNAFKRVKEFGIYVNFSAPTVAKVGRGARSGSTTSSLYELLIQENAFTAPNGNFPIAIGIIGVGKLTVLGNTVSSANLVTGPGYYAGLGVDIFSLESKEEVSRVQMAVAGTSLKVADNHFTGLTGGNGVGTFSKMVITDNIFSCIANGSNQAAFGIELHGGATACVTGNTFSGCSNGSGFKVVAAASTGQSLPCLQLTGNTASGNATGKDYDLNAPISNSPLHINSTYRAANTGNFLEGDLVGIERCVNCSR